MSVSHQAVRGACRGCGAEMVPQRLGVRTSKALCEAPMALWWFSERVLTVPVYSIVRPPVTGAMDVVAADSVRDEMQLYATIVLQGGAELGRHWEPTACRSVVIPNLSSLHQHCYLTCTYLILQAATIYISNRWHRPSPSTGAQPSRWSAPTKPRFPSPSSSAHSL